jgi:hypothetical protein
MPVLPLMNFIKKRIQQLFVIGIDNYESPAYDLLDNAVSDARLIIDSLQRRYDV